MSIPVLCVGWCQAMGSLGGRKKDDEIYYCCDLPMVRVPFAYRVYRCRKRCGRVKLGHSSPEAIDVISYPTTVDSCDGVERKVEANEDD